MDSFSVCVLMKERPSTIRRFIDHYKNAGAENIYVYLDGEVLEEPGASFEFGDDPAVSFTKCDATFWAETPSSNATDLDQKLVHTFHHAIRRNTSDWILFCDADELLAGSSQLGFALSALPAQTMGVRLRNSEAVWATRDRDYLPFTCQYERQPFPSGKLGKRLLPRLIYGRAWRELERGTTGHTNGKHMLRRGVVPDSMNSHTSEVGARNLEFLHSLLPQAEGIRIVHFDAIGYERWFEKWRMRLDRETYAADMSDMRRSQMARIGLAIGSNRGRQAFRTYNTLNRWQVFILKRLNLLDRLTLD